MKEYVGIYIKTEKCSYTICAWTVQNHLGLHILLIYSIYGSVAVILVCIIRILAM